jgi:hypothetical protein
MSPLDTNLEGSIATARTMVKGALATVFDEHATARFLIDILLSANFYAEALAQLVSVLTAPQQNAWSKYNYLSDRISMHVTDSKSGSSDLHLRGLERLCDGMLASRHGVYPVLSAILHAVRRICQSLPEKTCLLENYMIYEQLGALVHLVHSAIVLARERRPLIQQLDGADALTRALGKQLHHLADHALNQSEPSRSEHGGGGGPLASSGGAAACDPAQVVR